MSDTRLLQWIGEAEERRVLVHALSESPARFEWSVQKDERAWFGRLCRRAPGGAPTKVALHEKEPCRSD
jgi:hypothetical protein